MIADMLRKFITNDADPSEVDKLEKDSPVGLLIRAVYGKIDCGELKKEKFDESFIPFYSYLIIAIHRALFEQGGKCVRQLLDIADRLNPQTADFSLLLEFYKRIYSITEDGRVRNKKELYKVYNEFKDYFDDSFRALASPKIIKAVLVYLGVKGINADDIVFEDESYVHYYSFDVPLEEMVEKLGLVYTEDEMTLLKYYEKWFNKVKKEKRKKLIWSSLVY